MFVFCDCFVLSGRDLCNELITRPEESYRLWCVVVGDLENLKNEEAVTYFGSQRHRKKNTYSIILNRLDDKNASTRRSCIYCTSCCFLYSTVFVHIFLQ